MLQKMKNINKLTCALAAMLMAGSGFAQDLKHCNTDEMVKRSLENHPELKAGYLAEQARLEAIDQAAAAKGYKDESEAKLMPPVYIIPVVFHILHQNGPQNISDAQIIDQVRILNEDYRKLNTDISAVVPSFTSVTADCEIEFRL